MKNCSVLDWIRGSGESGRYSEDGIQRRFLRLGSFKKLRDIVMISVRDQLFDPERNHSSYVAGRPYYSPAASARSHVQSAPHCWRPAQKFLDVGIKFVFIPLWADSGISRDVHRDRKSDLCRWMLRLLISEDPMLFTDEIMLFPDGRGGPSVPEHWRR